MHHFVFSQKKNSLWEPTPFWCQLYLSPAWNLGKITINLKSAKSCSTLQQIKILRVALCHTKISNANLNIRHLLTFCTHKIWIKPFNVGTIFILYIAKNWYSNNPNLVNLIYFLWSTDFGIKYFDQFFF